MRDVFGEAGEINEFSSDDVSDFNSTGHRFKYIYLYI